jgi:hypothetical protein
MCNDHPLVLCKDPSPYSMVDFNTFHDGYYPGEGYPQTIGASPFKGFRTVCQLMSPPHPPPSYMVLARCRRLTPRRIAHPPTNPPPLSSPPPTLGCT